MLEIEDPYAAYCFDEACFYVEAELAAGKNPTYKQKPASMAAFLKELTGR